MGLRSLIPTGTIASREEVVQEVPVNNLFPSPFQPRTQFSEEALAELADSVKVHGILQPLVVRRVGGELQIIAGERRLQAAKQAGLERVPVVIREATDREMLELALVENLQREDINPIEAAEAYQRLMREFSQTQEQVAEQVGKSRSAVANALRLLNLPEQIRTSLRRGEISEGHGKVLAGIQEERIALRLWRRIIVKSLNVRETEKLAEKMTGRAIPGGTLRSRELLDPNIQEVLSNIADRLGCRVGIREKLPGTGGMVEIHYDNSEDLDRIYWAIMGQAAPTDDNYD